MAKSELKDDLNALLYWLCVEWGFCIPPEDHNRIVHSHHLRADDFAIEVLRAEGMNPEYEVEWRHRIRDQFIERFGKEVDAHSYRRDR